VPQKNIGPAADYLFKKDLVLDLIEDALEIAQPVYIMDTEETAKGTFKEWAVLSMIDGRMSGGQDIETFKKFVNETKVAGRLPLFLVKGAARERSLLQSMRESPILWSQGDFIGGVLDIDPPLLDLWEPETGRHSAERGVIQKAFILEYLLQGRVYVDMRMCIQNCYWRNFSFIKSPLKMVPSLSRMENIFRAGEIDPQKKERYWRTLHKSFLTRKSSISLMKFSVWQKRVELFIHSDRNKSEDLLVAGPKNSFLYCTMVRGNELEEKELLSCTASHLQGIGISVSSLRLFKEEAVAEEVVLLLNYTFMNDIIETGYPSSGKHDFVLYKQHYVPRPWVDGPKSDYKLVPYSFVSQSSALSLPRNYLWAEIAASDEMVVNASFEGQTSEVRKRSYFKVMERMSYVYSPKSALLFFVRGGLSSYFDMEVEKEGLIRLSGKRLSVLFPFRAESKSPTIRQSLEELCAQIDMGISRQNDVITLV